MKLNELKPILWTQIGEIQFAVIWDATKHCVIDKLTVQGATKKYGEQVVKQITAFENDLVISI